MSDTVDDQEQIPADQQEGDGEEVEEPEGQEENQEEGDEEPEEDKSKKRNRPGKLQRRLTQLEQQNAELLGYLRATQGSGEQQPSAEQSKSDPEPKYEDFDTDEAYQKAYTKWTVKQELRQEQEQQRQREQQTRQQREQQEFSQKLATINETGADKYDDYEEVALGTHWSPSEAMVHTIAETDNGHDVAYYLGSHPDEAKKIAQMPPYAAAAAIGRLSDKLAQPKQKQPSDAPEPVKRVRSGSGGGGTMDPDKMTPEQFVQWRQKELGSRKR